MSQRYTNLERKLANRLYKFPGLKRIAKRAWYSLNYHCLRKGSAYKILEPNTNVSFIGDDQQSFFFGYYDKSPFDLEEKTILFHKTSCNYDKKPSATDPVTIGLYDLGNKKERVLGQSVAWNWQQGSRLMWLDRNSILFNDYDSMRDSYITKIIKVADGDMQILPYPIYDVNKEGTFALSLSFERLASLRTDYGYSNKKTLPRLSKHDKNNGVWIIDLHQKKSRLLVSLSQLFDYRNRKSMKDAYHYVNHLMFSPNGRSFSFLHRWISKGIRYSRLFISDIEGNQLNCLLDENLVSHCYWYDDETILCWAKYKTKDNYYMVYAKTKEVSPIRNEFSEIEDGHPSFAPNRRFLITDTYPNRRRMKSIILIDALTGKYKTIAEFFEPIHLSEKTRCDLHPRWSPQGTYIAFDTAHRNRREIGIINIKEIIENFS